MFKNIVFAPKDPILGLTEIFESDQRKQKINLGIGVYKNELGKTPILTSIKKAEKYLLRNEVSKNYLAISGISEFSQVTQKLLFGKNHRIIKENCARTIQAIGGTGALRIAAEFIAKQTSAKRVWISQPTWPNHENIFKSVGFKICYYQYYDAYNHELNYNGMLTSLNDVIRGDVLLLHGCCHNPTGIDLISEQWEILSKLASEKMLLPVFDFAYQGFAKGLDKDTNGLHIFANKNPEIIVASSYSKNFSLYNERVGACTIIANNSIQADRVFSQIQSIIRANYSNPPFHGAAIVTKILSDELLKKEWIEELTAMRNRIQRIRKLFVKMLQEKCIKQDFSFIGKQNGIFSFSGLNKKQVIKLRNKHAIYIVNSGRINISGITENNLIPLCNAIIDVV
ncbi:Aspartate aminotransferase [Candidatus Arsenophonus lipoptenae]|uniref:Aminotransferase n=1 Tax=Candidatus Arsenophonus lipoptenae TaxID=634113 RepID=A0A109QE86_9GAMM|nr:amino acid aminotransferase [Candidatus Arsenophonus lipoptenae]AMA65115.1 Aspartate aminotransferase [Candidatus Arsenophonus lipoptenae]